MSKRSISATAFEVKAVIARTNAIYPVISTQLQEMKLQAIAKLNSEFDNMEKKLIDDIKEVKKEALATLRELDRANRISNNKNV